MSEQNPFEASVTVPQNLEQTVITYEDLIPGHAQTYRRLMEDLASKDVGAMSDDEKNTLYREYLDIRRAEIQVSQIQKNTPTIEVSAKEKDRVTSNPGIDQNILAEGARMNIILEWESLKLLNVLGFKDDAIAILTDGYGPVYAAFEQNDQVMIVAFEQLLAEIESE